MSESNTSAASRDLVVAHYREDLAWLNNLSADWEAVVYSKGDPPPGALPLPNVGREAHTYLHHIVDRYDDLADWTVFTQGFPFDHVPDFHKILNAMAEARGPEPGFIWLGLFIDYDVGDGSRLFKQWSKNSDGRGLALDKFWTEFTDEAAPKRYCFFPGAIFAVHRSVVHKQPKSIYVNALALSERFPDAAHCFERCWDRFFKTTGMSESIRQSDLPVYLRPVQRLGISWETRTRLPEHPIL